MIPELTRTACHGGQLLAWSALDGPTDYEHGLVARTTFDSPGFAIKAPGAGQLTVLAQSVTQACITGDAFWIEHPGGTIRGALLDAHHLLVEGGCTVTTSGETIAHTSDGTRTLLGAAQHWTPALLEADLDQAIDDRLRWLRAQLARLPQTGRTRQTLAKMLSIMKTQLYSPEGQIRHTWSTPDRWPHRDMWLWDSAFHAIGWRHLDPQHARDMIHAVLDTQRDDGFIALGMNPTRTYAITQPPILALGAWLVHQVDPDPDWLREIYPALGAYLLWDQQHRDPDGSGLVEWVIDNDPKCRSGESGMDNSPRFDHLERLKAVDFNSFLAHDFEILAQIADLLGLSNDAHAWRDRHAALCARIRETLWSEDLGFFVDFDVEGQQQVPLQSSAGFLPLLCGAATDEQAHRLADALHDPARFGTAFPVPSIAACEREHYSKDMWRGPTWINLNWLIAAGFARYDMPEVAQALRARSLEVIETGCARYGTAFEYFDDRDETPPPELLRKGRLAPDASPYHQVFHDYGWTACLYLDWVVRGEQSPQGFRCKHKQSI